MARLSKPIKPTPPKPRSQARTAQIRSLLRIGLQHRSRGQLDEALKAFDAILRLELENTDALFVKCQVFFEQQNYSRALHLLQRCLRSKSENPQLLYIVGYHYYQLKRFDKAVKLLTRAIDQNPAFVISRLLLGKIYAEHGQIERGRQIIEGVNTQISTRTSEQLTYANVLSELRLYDQALDVLKKLVNKDDVASDVLQDIVLRFPESYWDDHFDSALTRQLSRSNKSRDDEVRLHFAAGRVAEARGLYDEAFIHFNKGNELSDQSFDLETLRQTTTRLKQAFYERFDFRVYEPYLKQVTPLFIVGMPRSGKTSLENQLGRHPDVAAGKELDLRMYIDDDMIVRLQGRLPSNFEKNIDNFSIQKRKTYAHAYLDEVLPSLLRDGLPRVVTNTLPLNFQNAGFIKLVFPNAKFIHITRHPADTCWFCFSKNFKNEYTFTNSLDVLGKYYSIYAELCEHWASILPDDWLEISYERLIAEPEATRKRVFEFVGVEFDGAANAIKGANNDLTDKYIGHWKHYETQLQPLLAELNDRI